MPESDRARFSANRERGAVLRLLRGEELDLVSQELGLNGSSLSSWQESFPEGGRGALWSRARDARDEGVRELERTLGHVTMDNELLDQKIDRMEGAGPLGRRRSKR